MSLVQMFYISRAKIPYDDDSVKAILATSRRNNQRDDVTGCLLFSGRNFAQVLEGPSEVTSGRLDRISADTRHVDFRLLVARPITCRDYADWSMGYLHNLNLEDELEMLLLSPSVPTELTVAVMDRMKPDTVMGTLTGSFG